MTRQLTEPIRRHRLRWLLLSVLVSLICVGSIVYVGRQIRRERSELEQFAKQDKVTLKQVVADVERVRVKLGGAPKDQAELEMLLGKPLPEVHARWTLMPIRYFRKNEKDYYLVYLGESGYRRYDSDQPENGWTGPVD